ncbi:hypothetical protein P9112_003987 [Eukaryota sp. TZLM1-RC]
MWLHFPILESANVFITYRSIVHDSVRDQFYAMCKSFNIEFFIEPLVNKLSSDQTDDFFCKRRADLVAPGIDGVPNVVDVVSVDVCKNSAARLVYFADSPYFNAEKRKTKKYETPLAQLGRVEHVKYHVASSAFDSGRMTRGLSCKNSAVVTAVLAVEWAFWLGGVTS